MLSFLGRSVFETFFSVNAKMKTRRFEIVHWEERFRKVLFSLRIIVNGRPNRWNKTAFSNIFGLLWMLLYSLQSWYMWEKSFSIDLGCRVKIVIPISLTVWSSLKDLNGIFCVLSRKPSRIRCPFHPVTVLLRKKKQNKYEKKMGGPWSKASVFLFNGHGFHLAYNH